MATASELPIDTNASANDMANEMFSNGITIISASYTGSANASGTYSDGDATGSRHDAIRYGCDPFDGQRFQYHQQLGRCECFGWYIDQPWFGRRF